MKKILLLLCTLLGTVGAWATVTMPTLTTDPSNPVLYCIQSYRAYTFVQYAGDDTAMTPTFDFTSNNAKFYFVSVNGTDYSDGVKIVSSASGKQINEMSGFAETGTTWFLGESTYESGCFNISKNSGCTYPCWDCNSSGNLTADYWNPNTEGSTWQILSVDDLPQYQVSTLGSPKWYYLKTGRGRYVYADGSNAGTNTTNPKTDAYKFAFISTENHGVNIVSKAGLDAGKNQYLTTTPGLSNDPSAWYYFNAVRYAGYFVLSDANNGIDYPHLLNDNGAGGLAKWYVDGTGSYFQVEEVLPICDVTYTYTYGGNVYTETETQNIGAPVSLPASIKFPYTNYSFSADVVPDAATATINVTVTGFNMPFTASTDFASATWYYLHGHASYNNYYVSTNSDDIVWNTTFSSTDAYKWAFIGNPYDGIKVINKAAGDTKCLQETDPLTMGTTVKAWPIRQQTNTSWNSGANGFGLWSDANNQYVNAQSSTLKYWGSFDQGSTYWVTEATIAVTYELWVGGEKVDEVVVNDVAQHSAVDVPSTLTANYSPLAYNFATSGTIGNEDCTITVTATLKSNVITALNQLSNSKTYTLTTERGALYIKSDHLASNYNDNAGATAGKFAIISFENAYYLYSVDASKFVLNDGSLSTTVTSNVVALTMTEQTVKPLYLFVLGSNGLNVTDTNDNYELVINNYVTPDAGNRYCIEEVADFDATTQLADLNEFFHGQTAFNNTIAALKAINWGLESEGNKFKLHYYNFNGSLLGYAGNEMGLIEALEGQGYSAENLQAAQAMLASYALNMPTAGKFYRIKGNTSSKYLADGLIDVSGTDKFKMTDATDATTIFYFDGTKLTNFSSGMCNGMTSSAWAWVTGDAASTVVFQDGLTNGGYGIKSATCNFYDNGDHATTPSADRGNNMTITSSTNARYTSWYLEEVTSLPVTITAAGYATLYAPVALTIPSGVQAYYISSVSPTEATLTEIATTIPAATPVILKATADDYVFVTTTGGTDVSAANKLSGTLSAVTVADNEAYTLQRNVVNTETGLFPKAAGSIAGFKAYLPASNLPTAGVKGLAFKFVDVATGVTAFEEVQSSKMAYDLSGRRVSNPARGLYIVNGKKVVVK